MKQVRSDKVTTLTDRIKNACKGLFYVSETDSPIEYFWNNEIKETRADELLQWLADEHKTVTETPDIGEFFTRLTTVKEWNTTEQIKIIERFKKLRQILEKELTDLRLIRIGKIRVDIYVIGKTKTNEIAGIKTFSVET